MVQYRSESRPTPTPSRSTPSTTPIQFGGPYPSTCSSPLHQRGVGVGVGLADLIPSNLMEATEATQTNVVGTAMSNVQSDHTPTNHHNLNSNITSHYQQEHHQEQQPKQQEQGCTQQPQQVAGFVFTSRRNSKSRRGTQYRCGTCHEYGHNAKTCPQKKTIMTAARDAVNVTQRGLQLRSGTAATSNTPGSFDDSIPISTHHRAIDATNSAVATGGTRMMSHASSPLQNATAMPSLKLYKQKHVRQKCNNNGTALNNLHPYYDKHHHHQQQELIRIPSSSTQQQQQQQQPLLTVRQEQPILLDSALEAAKRRVLIAERNLVDADVQVEFSSLIGKLEKAVDYYKRVAECAKQCAVVAWELSGGDVVPGGSKGFCEDENEDVNDEAGKRPLKRQRIEEENDDDNVEDAEEEEEGEEEEELGAMVVSGKDESSGFDNDHHEELKEFKDEEFKDIHTHDRTS